MGPRPRARALATSAGPWRKRSVGQMMRSCHAVKAGAWRSTNGSVWCHGQTWLSFSMNFVAAESRLGMKR